jgi:hypothetical protein
VLVCVCVCVCVRCLLVASEVIFQITAVYQLRPRLFGVRVLVASRGQLSDITVVYQAVEGQIVVASRGLFSAVTVVYQLCPTLQE